ncbi:alpha/beta fold hydrolase [Calidifontibacter indicus]|uniref:TAP-like protein n=1 Tax=Calidifontibacter indicus TaxID=419650 RepID=A0A3D9UJZ5_9MICO|nr:alpha/beta fold hydrolase [Calidifontibacter indicus]REF29768.1 TAP-like protein [Calidifontibacter indicus]
MSQHWGIRALSATTVLSLVATLAACDNEPKVETNNSTSTSAAANGPDGKTGTPVGQLAPDGVDLSKFTGQQVQWSKDTCTSDVKELRSFSLRDLAAINARTECAKVKAPKDYSDPGKGEIDVMVTRTAPSKTPAEQRVLMTNPGGPGAPSGAFSVITVALSPLGTSHTVIGVDPRGVGGGTRVTCKSYGVRGVNDYRDLSDSDISKLQRAAKKTVDDCVSANGDLLPYITTANTARDHELVRQLVKTDKVDYYGVSAGTWLGAYYSTLFPNHVGRFVLDSNTEFTGSFQDSFGTQPMSFQRRFADQLLPWLARQNSTYDLGTTKDDVGKTYEDIRKAAGEGKLGQFEPIILDNIVAHTLYSDRGFESSGALLALLKRAMNGDSQALATAEGAAGGGGSQQELDDSRNQNTVFMAIRCNDTSWDKDPNSYVKTVKENGPKYPLVGYYDVANECAYWPYKAQDMKVDTSKAPQMLLVQTEDDPATAYEGGLKAHKASTNTRFLSVDDQGNHGAVLGGGNLCVEQQAYGFLQTGKLMDKDAVCPGVALPKDGQVHSVGFTPEGDKLAMPVDPTPQWKKALLAVLGAILDELMTPKNTTPRD